VQLVLILGGNHWPCNIDITKYQFYNMAARINSIVILELAATDLPVPCWNGISSVGYGDRLDACFFSFLLLLSQCSRS
jgi:hypothetical protein